MLRLEYQLEGDTHASSGSWRNDKEIITSPWRRHNMDELSVLLALYKGNPPITGIFL